MARQLKIVHVNDKMQRGYRYALTAPIGRNFDPEFRPELTPKQMLSLGVFCCVGVASRAAMIAAQIREVIGRQLGPRGLSISIQRRKRSVCSPVGFDTELRHR